MHQKDKQCRAQVHSVEFPFIAKTPYGVFVLASLNATFTVIIFMLSLTGLKETTTVFGIIQHCNCKHYAKLSRRGGRGGIQVPTQKVLAVTFFPFIINKAVMITTKSLS